MAKSKKTAAEAASIASANKKVKSSNSSNRKGGNVLDFLPIKSIENGLITFTNGKYGKVKC